MENENIVLERHKKRDYTVRYENKRFFWAGSKGNIVSKVRVPREVYDYLAMSTKCFDNGELSLSEDINYSDKEELLNEIYEQEKYENNSLSRVEVEKILKGTIPQMKNELEKITSQSTRQFVLDIAKEIKISNVNKQKFIRDWYGTELTIEDLFYSEEE